MDRIAAWTEDFIEQLTTFPNAKNDDMCDAMSQAAFWLLQHRFPTVRSVDVFTGKVYFEF